MGGQERQSKESSIRGPGSLFLSQSELAPQPSSILTVGGSSRTQLQARKSSENPGGSVVVSYTKVFTGLCENHHKEPV